MVGKPNTWWGSHTWWAAHIHGGLASQQASFGGGPGWMGARGARGAVFGFPTMYFDQGYQDFRYQDFRYQVSEKRRKKPKNCFFPKVKKKCQRIARFEAMTP